MRCVTLAEPLRRRLISERCDDPFAERCPAHATPPITSLVDDYPLHSTESALRRALGKRYSLVREVGRGGAALVFLAQDLKHDRPVAVKILRPEVAESLGAERFLREIGMAARGDRAHDANTIQDLEGEVMGTPLYMAPEQMFDEVPADARADLYSLVSMLYELLDGNPPYDGPTRCRVGRRSWISSAPWRADADRVDGPSTLGGWTSPREPAWPVRSLESRAAFSWDVLPVAASSRANPVTGSLGCSHTGRREATVTHESRPANASFKIVAPVPAGFPVFSGRPAWCSAHQNLP